MEAALAPLAVGLILILLGISNMRGNISSLHSYHRKRVSEADRIPFGRGVGLGNIVCGAALAVYGIFLGLSIHANSSALHVVGCVILGVGLVIGLGIAFRTMIKYNKGIF